MLLKFNVNVLSIPMISIMNTGFILNSKFVMQIKNVHYPLGVQKRPLFYFCRHFHLTVLSFRLHCICTKSSFEASMKRKGKKGKREREREGMEGGKRKKELSTLIKLTMTNGHLHFFIPILILST